jgi:hypothetical protein
MHSSPITKQQRTLHYQKKAENTPKQSERERERDLQRIAQSKERPESKAQTKGREYLDTHNFFFMNPDLLSKNFTIYLDYH